MRLSLRKLALGCLTLVLFILGWKLVTDAKLISPVFFSRSRAHLSSWSKACRAAHSCRRPWRRWNACCSAGCWPRPSASCLVPWLAFPAALAPFIAPTLELLRPLPASAMIPVAIAFLGFSDNMVLVIAFGALWPMLLATIHGFAAMEPRLYEVSACLVSVADKSSGSWHCRVRCPLFSPAFALAHHLAGPCSRGEMLASREGWARAFWPQAAISARRSICRIVILGAIGLCGSRLLSHAERRLLRWQAVQR